jgi:hypothetical protein
MVLCTNKSSHLDSRFKNVYMQALSNSLPEHICLLVSRDKNENLKSYNSLVSCAVFSRPLWN